MGPAPLALPSLGTQPAHTAEPKGHTVCGGQSAGAKVNPQGEH